MLIARVTGSVTATAKSATLTGFKLLVCALEDGKGKASGADIVAVDTVGAGRGDQVLLTTGSAARLPTQTTGAPVDAAIIAIIDSVDLG